MSRAHYAHWNEDADYMWWHEEGKHETGEAPWIAPEDEDEGWRDEDPDEDDEPILTGPRPASRFSGGPNRLSLVGASARSRDRKEDEMPYPEIDEGLEYRDLLEATISAYRTCAGPDDLPWAMLPEGERCHRVLHVAQAVGVELHSSQFIRIASVMCARGTLLS